MRRWWLLLGVSVLALVVLSLTGILFGFKLLWHPEVGITSAPPAPGITRENFKRLTPGMSRAEVVAILGQAGRYCGDGSGKCSVAFTVWKWEGKDHSVVLDIEDEVVVGGELQGAPPTGELAGREGTVQGTFAGGVRWLYRPLPK